AATNEHFTGNLTALISAFHSDNGKESMSGVLRVENAHMKTIAPEPKEQVFAHLDPAHDDVPQYRNLLVMHPLRPSETDLYSSIPA
ncbi:MAG: hypothetical protein Q9193_005990, partial [Seirophora villosa]